MIPGIRGTLLSGDALEQSVPDALRGLLDETGRGAAQRRLRAWHVPLRKQLGPASAPRTILDRLAVPLCAHLGYSVVPASPSRREISTGAPRPVVALMEHRGRGAATLVVSAWGQDAAASWRDAVRHGIAHDLRWCFCLTGPSLRIVDSQRTYSRQFVEFDVETTIDNDRTFAVLWGLLRADALAREGSDRRSLLERALAISESHRAAVRSSLQAGVNQALVHLNGALAAAARSRRRMRVAPSGQATFDEALVVIYRILFLLFAEARGLVPAWHPVFRDGYTIEALRSSIERMPRPRGLWETLQSIARLAHRGCRIGALRVTPFNGRLFSHIESPLADSLPLDDGAVRQALLALTTRQSRGGRLRIAYGDLGVEHLGGVYERLLDIEPAAEPAAATSRRRTVVTRTERRKATGSFYTPRSLTEYLVRRTLAPLVHDASPQQILSLRIVDPAMGSGAFLVAACRYLASAYEAALCRDGGFGPADIDERERADFRRAVAQRCLFGVDINPMAVQLGRLSLWLATLAADRPLTFLDHRLRVGNSLVGASPVDLARDPARRRGRTHARPSALPLFDDPGAEVELRDAVGAREAIATEPGDTLPQVRAKEQALARLAALQGSLARLSAACDLWCSGWFRDSREARGHPPFGPLVEALFSRGPLPRHLAAPILESARTTAREERFFHWSLEFPEVFHPLDATKQSGFDAVIGNPPWEMLRGDRGDARTRAAAKAAASRLIGFARQSGVYSCQGDGHSNLYHLFVERMASLVRSGGRLGIIVPSGLATDQGAAHLRRRLLDHTGIDTLVSFENRDGVFPIHRSLKFLLLCATPGATTPVLPCRFGVRRPEDLDRLPELGGDGLAVAMPRALLDRVSGSGLAIPDVRRTDDVELLSHCAVMIPALGDTNGWNVGFGRELNATDDKHYFRPAADGDGLPVIAGKLISPFAVDVGAAAHRMSLSDAAAVLNAARTYGRARLAYRDVASATNRLTLIAAIVPAGTVTTHTLFCVKETLDDESQDYLCGMLNSLVANYLVRLRVTTHVTTAIVDRLPVPKLPRRSAAFQEIVALTRTLYSGPNDATTYARLQACAARAYGLDRRQFQLVLETFPLVPRADRDLALAVFCDIVT